MRKEIKIGIFTLIALACLAIATIFTARLNVSAGKYYFIRFKSLDDLKNRSDVRVAGGINCGLVNSMSFDDEGYAVIRVIIYDQCPVTKNVAFTIQSAGLLGERYVGMTYDSNFRNEEVYEAGSTIRGRDPVSLSSIFEGLNDIIDITKGSLKGTDENKISEIIDGILKFFSNINLILDGKEEAVNVIVQKINKFLDEGSRLFEEFNDNVDVFYDTIDLLNRGVEQVMNDLNYTISDISDFVDQLSRDFDALINGPKGVNSIIPELNNTLKQTSDTISDLTGSFNHLIVKVNDIATKINVLVDGINNPKAPVGSLIHDESTTLQLKVIIKNLESITDKINNLKLLGPTQEEPGPY